MSYNVQFMNLILTYVSFFCSPDYNDCQIWGICDQLCEDRPGDHQCSCADGYILEQGHICKANVSGTD